MNQGCPGEGKDNRTLGWLICPLQRWLSWKSESQPKLLIITAGTSNNTEGEFYPVLAAASVWPPYLVINVRLPRTWGLFRVTAWRLFRIGWRYDNQWKGYIGPSAAWKRVMRPLTYY